MKRKRRRKGRWPGFVVLAAAVVIFGCATTSTRRRLTVQRGEQIRIDIDQEARAWRDVLTAGLPVEERRDLAACEAAVHQQRIRWAAEGTDRRRRQDEFAACACACGEDLVLRQTCREYHLPTEVVDFRARGCQASLHERLQQLATAQVTAERDMADLDASRSEQIARINSDHATAIAGMNARLAEAQAAQASTPRGRNGSHGLNGSQILPEDRDVIAHLPNSDVQGIHVASVRLETRTARRPRPSAPHPPRPVPAVRSAAHVQPAAPVSRPVIVPAVQAPIVPALVAPPAPVSAPVINPPVARVPAQPARAAWNPRWRGEFPPSWRGLLVLLIVIGATWYWLLRRANAAAVASIEAAIDSVEIFPYRLSHRVGDSYDFGVVVTAAGQELTDVVVHWSSTNKKVVTIDQEGTMTAIAPGAATIRAKAGSFWDEKEVIVEPRPPQTDDGTI